MYVPEDYANYNRVVSYHDNYVVLTNRSSVSASYTNPQTINVIYQYFKPSTYTFTSTATVTSDRSFERIDTGSSFYDRADCPELVTSILLLTLFLLFIINGATKFVKKGGIFGA